MTKSYEFDGQIQSISAGSEFKCGLFSQNTSVFYCGDETGSRVMSLIPMGTRFKIDCSWGYHVCGILEGVDSRVVYWGMNLDFDTKISASLLDYVQHNVDLAQGNPML
ncbi:Serine/threonine-protein kinase-like protein ACR4 [Forsythia ovata]|uniref:non-specific serine/threonine protein kinase n=1 Tax=Forsythia ovata TaxID=205694 RepID=A0ABD1RIY7_9LAMI